MLEDETANLRIQFWNKKVSRNKSRSRCYSIWYWFFAECYFLSVCLYFKTWTRLYQYVCYIVTWRSLQNSGLQQQPLTWITCFYLGKSCWVQNSYLQKRIAYCKNLLLKGAEEVKARGPANRAASAAERLTAYTTMLTRPPMHMYADDTLHWTVVELLHLLNLQRQTTVETLATA